MVDPAGQILEPLHNRVANNHRSSIWLAVDTQPSAGAANLNWVATTRLVTFAFRRLLARCIKEGSTEALCGELDTKP